MAATAAWSSPSGGSKGRRRRPVHGSAAHPGSGDHRSKRPVAGVTLQHALAGPWPAPGEQLVEVNGAFSVGPPKSAASRRTVALPAVVVEALAEHLARYTAKSPEAFVFLSSQGDRRRRLAPGGHGSAGPLDHRGGRALPARHGRPGHRHRPRANRLIEGLSPLWHGRWHAGPPAHPCRCIRPGTRPGLTCGSVVEPPPESNRRPHPYYRCVGGSQRRPAPHVPTQSRTWQALPRVAL